MSYTASGRQFEDREKFPRLYRLQPLVISYNKAYVHLITSFGWRRVAVIYEVNPLFSKVHSVAGASERVLVLCASRRVLVLCASGRVLVLCASGRVLVLCASGRVLVLCASGRVLVLCARLGAMQECVL